MKSILFTSLASLFLCMRAIAHSEPAKPDLTFLYTVNITAGTFVDIGTGPRGDQLVVPITGGSFVGPILKGKVLPLGGDWPVFDANGTLTIDARHTYQTDDGAYIQTFESGTTQPDGSAHVRVTFETASSKYYWLNRAVGVGIIPPLTSLNFVVINYWLLVAPS